MKRNALGFVEAVATAVGATVGVSSLAAGQATPTMSGGYTNVIAIPVDDPTTKAIAGALLKPEGAGPFPAVVYMPGCAGLHGPAEAALEESVIGHLLAKGVATLIVDPLTPRNEQGICASLANLNEKTNTQVKYAMRGGNDALAAVKVLKAMPEIDPDRIFVQGYSYGATSSLFATDAKTPGVHDTQITGVIAYYPYCYDNLVPSRPTLVLIGDKDDWMSVGMCQAFQGKPDFDVVVYLGAFHAFALPLGQPVDHLGHHIAYDEKATLEAQRRADAFMDAHLK
jgi:dienelactone hydrolase